MNRKEDELLDPPVPDEDPSAYPWRNAIDVDKTLLTPQATSKVIVIAVPVYEKKTVAVALYNKDGVPMLNEKKEILYKEKETSILVGTKQQEVDLPGGEIYNVDLASSYLNDREVAAIRSAQALYTELQLQILQGKDRLSDLHYVYGRIMGVIETSKAREGQTAQLAKTTISKGQSQQEVIQRFKEEEKKKKWLPGQQ